MKKFISIFAVASLCLVTAFAAKSYVLAAPEGEETEVVTPEEPAAPVAPALVATQATAQGVYLTFDQELWIDETQDIELAVMQGETKVTDALLGFNPNENDYTKLVAAFYDELQPGAYTLVLPENTIYGYANEEKTVAVAAQGIPFTIHVVAPGDYYIKHVATGKFLGGANSWGTHASLLDHAQIFTVVALADGKYKLDSHTYNNATDHFLGADFIDNGGNEFTFTAVEGGVNIANGDKFVAAVDGGLVNTAEATADVWQFVTYDEMIAALADATEEAPMDATFAIKAANFSRNHYRAGYETYPWIVENCGNKNLQGGNNENMCAESFHSTFNIYQTLKNMPYGVYALKAQGFYRIDGGGSNVPVFYANAETMAFPLKTGTENSMGEASTSFSAGLYTIEPIYVLVENGELTIGVKNETETNLWCIWDNFELSYLGEKADYEALVMPKFLAQVKALLEEIKTLNEEYAETPMEYSAKYYLTYYSNDENKPRLETLSQVKESITMLNGIIAKAKSSVAEYAQAAKTAASIQKYAEAAGINLNTASYESDYQNGYLYLYNGHPLVNEYNEQLAEILSKTINKTDLIQNPSFETKDMTGWSATGLHAATNKNFGMKTGESFVENWTPGPGKLADETLEQTITLPAGKYILTAEAQLLQQGDASVVPGGFFLFAGDNKSEITNLAATIVLPFTVEEEAEVAIGAKIEGCTGNWASIDNFRLFQAVDATPVDFAITPEAGTVESLKTITISAPEGVALTVADKAVVTVYTESNTVGRWVAESLRSNMDENGVITLNLPYEYTAAGTYTIEINEGAFQIKGGGYTAAYTKPLWTIEYKPLEIVSSELSSKGGSITFNKDVNFAGWNQYLTDCYLTDAAGKKVESQVTMFVGTAYNELTVQFDPELAAGEYTLNIPDGAIYEFVNWSVGQPLKATTIDFTITPTGVEGIAANGMKNGKFVKNNRIVIVRNGKAYNAAGARIQK